MEFGFTEEQEKLREELMEFFRKELPEDVDGGVPAVSKELQDFWLDLQKKAGAKGYLAPGWPKESGGLGYSHIEVGIANEVNAYWGVAWPDSIGLHICGPGIHLFGTDEQKKRLLPEISSGRNVWFECFTEPDAGTDEANQQTRAVKDGDYYVLNGQKIYITGGFRPDWIYAEARTADTVPRHRGLTLFAFPTDTPGVSIKALPCMGGYRANEVFFDDVRVHKDTMVGQENQGFYHVMQTFEFERSNTGGAVSAKRRLQSLVKFCKEEKRNGKPLIENPEIRKKLALMAIDTEVLRLAAWRTCWRFAERKRLGPLDFDLTGFFVRANAETHPTWQLEILGDYAQLRHGSKWAKLKGSLDRQWRITRSYHYAGTTEVMKLVLAGRVLGLPRIPAKLNTTIMQALQEKK